MIPIPAHALVVSCQAGPENPLHGPSTMARMATAVVVAGAAAIRANGPADVAAIRAAVPVPIIGIHKLGEPDGVFITPTAAAAAEVIKAGADVVALDGTRRPRPDGTTLVGQIAAIHELFGVPVMADVDDLAAGLAARAAGADIVATTLSGYTGGRVPDGPDLALVAALVAHVDCPVIAEGRFSTPALFRAALDAGAHAVVVGQSITDPAVITRNFLRAVS